MFKFIKKYYYFAVVFILLVISIGGYFFPETAFGARTSNFWKTVGNELRTIRDFNVNIFGDLLFQGEMRPDGQICANGEILKRLVQTTGTVLLMLVALD